MGCGCKETKVSARRNIRRICKRKLPISVNAAKGGMMTRGENWRKEDHEVVGLDGASHM
jgi:hypothetical protein